MGGPPLSGAIAEEGLAAIEDEDEDEGAAAALRAWKSCLIRTDFSCSRLVMKLPFFPTSSVSS